MQLGFGADALPLSKVKDYLRLAAVDVVHLSPGYFRDFSCPSGCFGCCNHGGISLDYLKDSDRWRNFKKNFPVESAFFYEVKDPSGEEVMRYHQEHAPIKTRCHFGNDEGRCTIHTGKPFPCSFSFGKFRDMTASYGNSTLTTEKFGRSWNFKRIDGGKGSLCEFLPFDYEKFTRDLDNLRELRDFGRKLKIPSKLKYIIEYLEDHQESYKVDNNTIPKEKIIFTGENVY